jgi:Carbohydrate esterase, sialic acid-specific acetylesterase
LQFFRYVAAILLLVIASVSYVFGAMSYHRQYWPIPQLRSLKQATAPFVPANHAVTDELDRLVAFGGKQEIPCPRQTPKTRVLLIAGQSNAANSGGQRYQGSQGVINFFDGKCYQAASPLLGSTGIAGDSWTLLGNKLIEHSDADHVILIATAMSGTSITKWEAGGDLNPMLMSVIADATKAYHITDVLWHQGEWDVGSLTKDQYREKFLSLLSTIRGAGVTAPVYVSIATRCELTDIPWVADNEISSAQKSLPNAGLNIRQGVDTDAIVKKFDRVDDCHFAESGQEKMANEWFSILSSE